MMNRIFMLVIIIFTGNVYAAVNYTNGNFYTSYTDIIVSTQGKDLRIDRTYNSMATETGWFGFGWGSNYETFLTVSPDGSVIVHENGAGSRTRFVPETSIDPVSAAKLVSSAMVEQEAIEFRDEKRYLDMLKQNADLRQAYARKYGVSVSLTKGTELFANKRAKQKIVVTDNGYLRISDGGDKTEYFSNLGKLSSIRYRNDYLVTLIYDKSGHVKEIKDSLGNQLIIGRDNNHRVISVHSSDDKQATYKYAGENLVHSTDTNGTIYKYSYDTKHNLTAINYADDSQTRVSYQKDTQMVEKVTYSNGDVKEYHYGVNPQTPESGFWTEVITTNKRGKKDRDHYYYEMKTNSDGSAYIYFIKNTRHGVVTETVYNKYSYPLNISRGNYFTSFQYKDGLLIEKRNSRGEFYQIEYAPESNKITKVTNKWGWTEYAYDSEQNLINVVDDKGTKIDIGYDKYGRIISINSMNSNNHENQIMTMEYNSMGNPVLIKIKDVGAINVTYDEYGEIDSVDSEGGMRIAAEVTYTFQSLLALIKPRGIDLNL